MGQPPSREIISLRARLTHEVAGRLMKGIGMPLLLFLVIVVGVAFLISVALSLVSLAFGLVFGLLGLAFRLIPIVLVVLVVAFFVRGGHIERGEDGSFHVRPPRRRDDR